MRNTDPVVRSQVRTPNIGKGGHHVRGTAAQRREFYEKFRAHTDEVLERLLTIVRDSNSDDGHAIQAGKEILNRGWGAAPQVNVIEAVLQHQHIVNMEALRQLPGDQLSQLEVTLARLVEVEDAEVIETSNESTDHAPTASPAPRRRQSRA